MRALAKSRGPGDTPELKTAANADSWLAAVRYDAQQLSTARISVTSAAVCIGILVWALVNAYLSQL